MKHNFPKHNLKTDFTVGTMSENFWKLGEVACVDNAFYALPDGEEYAFYKFVERTKTGGKKSRWEEWHNGKFSNNYFGGFDEALLYMDNYIAFCGFPGTRQNYRVY